MKINSSIRTTNPELGRTDGSNKLIAPKQFSDIMKQRDEQTTIDELKIKLQKIYEQGDRLSKNMTIRELSIYRKMLRQFLEDTLRKGIGLKETGGFDRRGRHKRYHILQEIESTLISLGEQLLETEDGRIQLLSRIGDIRGMLINLFF